MHVSMEKRESRCRSCTWHAQQLNGLLDEQGTLCVCDDGHALTGDSLKWCLSCVLICDLISAVREPCQ